MILNVIFSVVLGTPGHVPNVHKFLSFLAFRGKEFTISFISRFVIFRCFSWGIESEVLMHQSKPYLNLKCIGYKSTKLLNNIMLRVVDL